MGEYNVNNEVTGATEPGTEGTGASGTGAESYNEALGTYNDARDAYEEAGETYEEAIATYENAALAYHGNGEDVVGARETYENAREIYEEASDEYEEVRGRHEANYNRLISLLGDENADGGELSEARADYEASGIAYHGGFVEENGQQVWQQGAREIYEEARAEFEAAALAYHGDGAVVGARETYLAARDAYETAREDYLEAREDYSTARANYEADRERLENDVSEPEDNYDDIKDAYDALSAALNDTPGDQGNFLLYRDYLQARADGGTDNAQARLDTLNSAMARYDTFNAIQSSTPTVERRNGNQEATVTFNININGTIVTRAVFMPGTRNHTEAELISIATAALGRSVAANGNFVNNVGNTAFGTLSGQIDWNNNRIRVQAPGRDSTVTAPTVNHVPPDPTAPYAGGTVTSLPDAENALVVGDPEPEALEDLPIALARVESVGDELTLSAPGLPAPPPEIPAEQLEAWFEFLETFNGDPNDAPDAFALHWFLDQNGLTYAQWQAALAAYNSFNNSFGDRVDAHNENEGNFTVTGAANVGNSGNGPRNMPNSFRGRSDLAHIDDGNSRTIQIDGGGSARVAARDRDIQITVTNLTEDSVVTFNIYARTEDGSNPWVAIEVVLSGNGTFNITPADLIAATNGELSSLFRGGNDFDNIAVGPLSVKPIHPGEPGPFIPPVDPPDDPIDPPNDPIDPPDDPTDPPETPTDPPETPTGPPETPTDPPETPTGPPVPDTIITATALPMAPAPAVAPAPAAPIEAVIDDAIIPLTPFTAPAPEDYETIITIEPPAVPLAPAVGMGEIAGFLTTGLILAALTAAVIGNTVRRMRTEEAANDDEGKA